VYQHLTHEATGNAGSGENAQRGFPFKLTSGKEKKNQLLGRSPIQALFWPEPSLTSESHEIHVKALGLHHPFLGNIFSFRKASCTFWSI